MNETSRAGRFDAAVVGGGVVGASAAYCLSRAGLRVVLIEAGAVASGASGAAAGMLGAQLEVEEPGPLLALALRGRRLFDTLVPALEEATGLSLGYRPEGIVRVALDEEGAQVLHATAKQQEALGLRARWVEAADLASVLGLPEPPRVEGAVLLEEDGQIEPEALTAALIASAPHLRLMLGRQAVSIRPAARGWSVDLAGGASVEADRVLLATGCGSGPLLSGLGVRLSVPPVKGEMLVLQGPTPLRRTVFGPGAYLVPKASGRLYLGATMEPGATDTAPSLAGSRMLLDGGVRLFDALWPGGAPGLRIAGWRVGLRPGSPDGLPILGPVPGHRGLFVATGHLRNGILLGPVSGWLLSAWMQGSDPLVALEEATGADLPPAAHLDDLAPFLPDRLAR
ncbi:NAD(P)/FAD-dependent oxidoreductase [Limnochorda pilosa]|uniref:Glycine oxidase n=1 Tax=Limnochorda pilosa TaxID=1555112 RepID=A0A0K2SH38_LIMPI|nr:FAD-dependent oxidoreductase [Limnochorda pilosa]BAS26139.1 glycine oxidase [Limnochorda pilosa]